MTFVFFVFACMFALGGLALSVLGGAAQGVHSRRTRRDLALLAQGCLEGDALCLDVWGECFGPFDRRTYLSTLSLAGAL